MTQLVGSGGILDVWAYEIYRDVKLILDHWYDAFYMQNGFSVDNVRVVVECLGDIVFEAGQAQRCACHPGYFQARSFEAAFLTSGESALPAHRA